MSETHTIRLSDYSLVGRDSKLAVEKGLAEAAWYTSPIPKVVENQYVATSNKTIDP